MHFDLKFSKPIEEIIESRISRRTYKKDSIDAKVLGKLSDLIKEPFVGPLDGKSRFIIVDKEPLNSDEKIRIGTYGMIIGAKNFIVGIIDKNENKLEDFGYNFEKIILKSSEIGLDTCWLGAKFTGRDFEKKANILGNEYIPAISPIGYALDNPDARESILSWGIKARKRKAWSRLFFSNNFGTSLEKLDNDTYSRALEMVRIAPSARNEQPWRIVRDSNDNYHFYIHLRLKRKEVRIPTLKRIDLGIAMCHFDLTLQERGIHGKWFVDDPKINTEKSNLYYISSWSRK